MYIKSSTLKYIQKIVDHYPKEISWVYHVTNRGNIYYVGDKVFIPPQKCTGATTEFEATDIWDMIQSEPDFDRKLWRGWGHSHVSMGVTPSGQDRSMMLEFSKSCDFFLGTIHNKRGDMLAWITDTKSNKFYQSVDVYVTDEEVDKELEEIKALCEKRVGELKYESSRAGYTPGMGYYGNTIAGRNMNNRTHEDWYNTHKVGSKTTKTPTKVTIPVNDRAASSKVSSRLGASSMGNSFVNNNEEINVSDAVKEALDNMRGMPANSRKIMQLTDEEYLELVKSGKLF